MGVLAIVVAGLSEFVDDKDRFFTPDIGQITAFEWGICIWIACQGKDQVFSPYFLVKTKLYVNRNVDAFYHIYRNTRISTTV